MIGLVVVQLTNGRYALQNTFMGSLAPGEWRTRFFAERAANRRMRKLKKTMLAISKGA